MTESHAAFPVLSARNLSRVFGKKEPFIAVADVSLDVHPGEVVGLLGPNGAGKTTTVRMCSTMLAATSGTVTIGGIDAVAHPERARGRLGVGVSVRDARHGGDDAAGHAAA
ncbi:MAG: ATP-binding cassette domain-containing protein [Actinomycetaceae bacterium]|nr:ATP-binding cassette domain-containing protein [Actinomycetaceae bacterium]MDU0971253.1 ATP-binding cassette domain-containing protein [Actinomycetaceae bacterium]